MHKQRCLTLTAINLVFIVAVCKPCVCGQWQARLHLQRPWRASFMRGVRRWAIRRTVGSNGGCLAPYLPAGVPAPGLLAASHQLPALGALKPAVGGAGICNERGRMGAWPLSWQSTNARGGSTYSAGSWPHEPGAWAGAAHHLPWLLSPQAQVSELSWKSAHLPARSGPSRGAGRRSCCCRCCLWARRGRAWHHPGCCGRLPLPAPRPLLQPGTAAAGQEGRAGQTAHCLDRCRRWPAEGAARR